MRKSSRTPEHQAPVSEPAGEDWLEAELEDTFDEEYELELSDPALAKALRKVSRKAHPPSIARAEYFRTLLKLQAELIKLQDWVSHHKEKIIVIFEGRDSAGKGGVIKRIMQRLNPRICRVIALPAPTERERTQWYFQRYVPHLPAGGEIVLFDRSWYNRSGVERVMGFASADQAIRHPPDQILVLDHRRRAAAALFDAHSRSTQAVETLTDGPAIPGPLGGLYEGERGDIRPDQYPGIALVCRRSQ
jgi:hypothetical protein